MTTSKKKPKGNVVSAAKKTKKEAGPGGPAPRSGRRMADTPPVQPSEKRRAAVAESFKKGMNTALRDQRADAALTAHEDNFDDAAPLIFGVLADRLEDGTLGQHSRLLRFLITALRRAAGGEDLRSSFGFSRPGRKKERRTAERGLAIAAAVVSEMDLQVPLATACGRIAEAVGLDDRRVEQLYIEHRLEARRLVDFCGPLPMPGVNRT